MSLQQVSTGYITIQIFKKIFKRPYLKKVQNIFLIWSTYVGFINNYKPFFSFCKVLIIFQDVRKIIKMNIL